MPVDRHTHLAYTGAGKHILSSHTHTTLNVLCTTVRLHVCIHRKKKAQPLNNCIENRPILDLYSYSDMTQQCCACYPCEHERKTNRTQAQRNQFECSSHSMNTTLCIFTST